MIYTRTVMYEFTREYDSIQEARNDEDNMLELCSSRDFPNAALYENKLTDEEGSEVLDDE